MNMEEAVNLFVDGELPGDRQPEFFAHLAVCASCRHSIDSILKFRRIGRQEYISVPPAVDDAFFKRLAQHKSNGRRVNRYVDRDPVWRMHTRLSLRSVVMVSLVVFIAGLLIQVKSSTTEIPSSITGEVERIEFIENAQQTEAVYVFYPGLIVEASKLEEIVEPM